MAVIGLELGATWIRGVVLHPDGKVGERIRELTPHNPDEAAQLLFSLWQRLGSDQMVGVAAAPSLSETGTVRRWPNRPEYIGTDILKHFGARKVRPLILDDASAASVAEHLSATEGNCMPSSTVYISVGTGVGAGLVLSDRLWSGATGQAMDLGHVRVAAAADTKCACGERGCLQSVASGRALERLAQELRHPSKNVLELAATDPQVTQIFSFVSEPLAQAIILVEKLIEPDRIVLGGGLMSEDVLFNSVALAAQRLGSATPISKSRWGTWSGALGAAVEVFRRAGLSIARLTENSDPVAHRLALIQGPNLNLLGEREPEHYGTSTIQEIEQRMRSLAKELGCHLYCVQSNSESNLVDWLQQRLDRLEGVILNPAALTAHGYALRDALTAKKLPFIEVHLSNVYNREAWHQESCFAAVALARISGIGDLGYELALRGLIKHLSKGAE